MKPEKFDQLVKIDPWFPWIVAKHIDVTPRWVLDVETDLDAPRPLGGTDIERRLVDSVNRSVRNYFVSRHGSFVAVRPFDSFNMASSVFYQTSDLGPYPWSDESSTGKAFKATLMVTHVVVYTVGDKKPREHQRFRKSIGMCGGTVEEMVAELRGVHRSTVYLDAVLRQITVSVGTMCEGVGFEMFKCPQD